MSPIVLRPTISSSFSDIASLGEHADSGSCLPSAAPATDGHHFERVFLFGPLSLPVSAKCRAGIRVISESAAAKNVGNHSGSGYRTCWYWLQIV